MIALAVDENFDNHILRALLRRVVDLDARTVSAAGLVGADDPTVLEWAAREGRVLLTHDVHTMTRFAYERVTRGDPMPGVIEVRAQAPIGAVLDDFRDQVFYVPLR